jgi:hypothetical protein
MLERENIFFKYRALINKPENKRWFLEHICEEMGLNPAIACFNFMQAEAIFAGYIETAKRYDGKLLVPALSLVTTHTQSVIWLWSPTSPSAQLSVLSLQRSDAAVLVQSGRLLLLQETL